MAFDWTKFFRTAMVDSESYYPSIETKNLFTPDK